MRKACHVLCAAALVMAACGGSASDPTNAASAGTCRELVDIEFNIINAMTDVMSDWTEAEVDEAIRVTGFSPELTRFERVWNEWDSRAAQLDCLNDAQFKDWECDNIGLINTESEAGRYYYDNWAARCGSGVVGTTVATTTTEPVLAIVQLAPVSVDCTSELAAFPCSALIDNDPSNSWNATEGGIGDQITVVFSPPVQITEMSIQNLRREETFERNARMKGIEIVTDDLSQAIVVDLEDSNEPQRVEVRSLRTSALTITITSAYPGRSFEGRQPFLELAVEEIMFFGRVSPDDPG